MKKLVLLSGVLVDIRGLSVYIMLLVVTVNVIKMQR